MEVDRFDRDQKASFIMDVNSPYGFVRLLARVQEGASFGLFQAAVSSLVKSFQRAKASFLACR